MLIARNLSRPLNVLLYLISAIGDKEDDRNDETDQNHHSCCSSRIHDLRQQKNEKWNHGNEHDSGNRFSLRVGFDT